mgnify:CR=1 FL=1
MTDLYLIVHERTVRNCETVGIPGAEVALAEIERIKREEEFLEFTIPSSLAMHPELPPPSDDLTIAVLGAYKELCVFNQHYLLEMQGYNVQYHLPRCVSVCDDEGAFFALANNS